ncbi:MAG: hypothetical protein WCL06_14970 [Bacteroidota bacterium]
MRTSAFITILLSMSLTFSYAQNEKPNREAYTLKLPVDQEKFYQQEVPVSPYFVKDDALQIFANEKLYIEVEADKKEITSMKVVKENLHPEKTLEVELTQEVKDKKSEMMMLKVYNPFKYTLEYSARMFIVGHDQWIKTSIMPVRAKISGIETWPEVIISMALYDWKFK